MGLNHPIKKPFAENFIVIWCRIMTHSHDWTFASIQHHGITFIKLIHERLLHKGREFLSTVETIIKAMITAAANININSLNDLGGLFVSISLLVSISDVCTVISS